MNWQFQYTQAFWALAAIPVFLLFYLSYILWRRWVAKKMGNPKLVKELHKNHSPVKAASKFFLVIIAFALGCLAIANPRKPDNTFMEARKGIDIMIALDVSNSMLANDMDPDRLSNAKEFIFTLMNRLPDDRIGLVLFAGSAYVQMPLTFDRSAAEVIVSAANPAALPAQGTSISDALKKADLAFPQDSKRFKTVVLVTDGETHDENAVETANELKEKGIMINTVGIGSPGGAAIIDPVLKTEKRDLSGKVVVSKLNEQLLQQVAAATNGQYVHFTSAAAVTSTLVKHLSQIEKTAIGDPSSFTYTSFYIWLALPMLLLLVAELFIPDRKRKMA